MKSTLKELLATTSSATAQAQEMVEGGEHMMTPVYQSLNAAKTAIANRIYQIESNEADNAAKVAAEEKAKADAAAAEKAKADRAKFEADAIAKAEAERAAEIERVAAYEAKRAGESRDRYGKKSLDDLKAIAGKRNVTFEAGVKKAQLVNMLLQADGIKVTQADQEAADKE